jgi:hypothetical protein
MPGGVCTTPLLRLGKRLLAFSGFFWFWSRSFWRSGLALSKLPTVRADIKLGPFLAGLFVFPGILADRALDQYFLTVIGELGKVFGGWPPHLDIDECGDLLPFAVFCGVELIDRQRSVNYRRAFGRVDKFGVRSQITGE